MAFKIIILAVAALVAVSQGQAYKEITLEEETYTYLTNDLIGKSITIPKSFLDELQTCHVVFPNGVTYEAYPEENIPYDNVFFLYSAQPFTSCAIGFRGVAVELSGSYQLKSLVKHSTDDSLSLTNLKVNLEVKEIEEWNEVVAN